MSTVIDYVGRKVDYLAFRGVLPFMRGREQLLAQEMVSASDGGAIIAGVQKFAQTFLLILLLEKGSRAMQPTAGTLFMTEARYGLWRTVADVKQSFISARLDAKRQYQAKETIDDPDDEKYGNAELTSVTLNGDRVSITITLTTLAGTTYTFLTPITVAIK